MYKPEWLKIKHQNTPELHQVEELLRSLSLNTVCDEAACPNRLECFGRKTATFLILGRQCTRNCKFCNVESDEESVKVESQTEKATEEATEEALYLDEPRRISEAVSALKLKHVVITSVTRDDLPDGGASHFAKVIDALKKHPHLTIEVLIPDFLGNADSLRTVFLAAPNIIGHNIETVKRLYPEVRAKADYRRSLDVLREVKRLGAEAKAEVEAEAEADADAEEFQQIFTKSSIMLGLGETQAEVLEVLSDLRKVDCDFLCIGQYLSPTKLHYPVVEYIHPDQFAFYRKTALDMGFKFVASGPFVRSSYHADEAMNEGQFV